MGLSPSVLTAYENAKLNLVEEQTASVHPNIEEVPPPLSPQPQAQVSQPRVEKPPPPPQAQVSQPQVEASVIKPQPLQTPVVKAETASNSQSSIDPLGSLIAGEGGHHRRLVNRGSSVIVVGGSDGSGTRRYLKVLPPKSPTFYLCLSVLTYVQYLYVYIVLLLLWRSLECL